MSKSRSARGEIVDFDLLKLKSEIAATPLSEQVTKRKEFIASKENGKKRQKSPPVVTTKEPSAALP